MVSVVIRRAAAAVVATVVCAGLLSANPAAANPTTADPGVQPGEAAGAVELVEAVTGTADVVDVAPGESGVAVTVPVEADEAVHIDTASGSVSFEQPHSPAGGEVVVSDHGTVSYLNDDAPFNTHLQVVASPDPLLLSQGARSLIEIESIHAPREYVYPVAAGEGVVLTVQPDGGVLGTRGEQVVLVVPAPWARDAAGAVVPTRYEVRGTDLVQIVDFNPAHAFPIIADPLWFVVLAAALRAAAARAAAARAAAAVAARTVVLSIRGRIASDAARRCYHGFAIGSLFGTIPAVVEQRRDGSWWVGFNGNSAIQWVAAAVGGCLSTRIR